MLWTLTVLIIILILIFKILLFKTWIVPIVHNMAPYWQAYVVLDFSIRQTRDDDPSGRNM
jgi:hypothetical protein